LQGAIGFIHSRAALRRCRPLLSLPASARLAALSGQLAQFVIHAATGAPGHGSTAAETPEPLLTSQLSEEFQRELAAPAQAQRQLHAGEEESHGRPVTPSLHHCGTSVGPGRLFVHRASFQESPNSSPSSRHSNGGGGMVEPTSTRPSESPRAVELAPLPRRPHKQHPLSLLPLLEHCPVGVCCLHCGSSRPV